MGGASTIDIFDAKETGGDVAISTIRPLSADLKESNLGGNPREGNSIAMRKVPRRREELSAPTLSLLAQWILLARSSTRSFSFSLSLFECHLRSTCSRLGT